MKFKIAAAGGRSDGSLICPLGMGQDDLKILLTESIYKPSRLPDGSVAQKDYTAAGFPRAHDNEVHINNEEICQRGLMRLHCALVPVGGFLLG